MEDQYRSLGIQRYAAFFIPSQKKKRLMLHIILTLISKNVRIFQMFSVVWFGFGFFFLPFQIIFYLECCSHNIFNRNHSGLFTQSECSSRSDIYESRINNVKPTERLFLIPTTFNECYHRARNEQDMKGVYSAIDFMKYYALFLQHIEWRRRRRIKKSEPTRCWNASTHVHKYIYRKTKISQIFYLFISVKGKNDFTHK